MSDQQTDPDSRFDLSDAGSELEAMAGDAPMPPPVPGPPAGMSPSTPAAGGDEDVTELEIELPEEAAHYVEQLRQQLDEAVAARQRALADFRNFQRRSLDNEQKAMAGGVRRVIQSLLPVLDHFDLALSLDPDRTTLETVLNGVRIVRDEISKALQLQGVEVIVPQPGDEFDPNQHEAILRQPREGVGPNGIVQVMQPGYRLGDVVLRPAKVAIAPEAE